MGHGEGTPGVKVRIHSPHVGLSDTGPGRGGTIICGHNLQSYEET